ncbi:hypothetical protein EVAR_86923_1 [Eumeta japonica]|uniref:Uncharacterized protein n=1 Tax=Eumeta variegata TaxID=151549 RepID=A0A4C1W6I1_EUMVA|nr:hypothetical protein EVAR_86923_1 [Eumeta japonica]
MCLAWPPKLRLLSMPTPSTLVYATAAIEVPSSFNVGDRWNLLFSVIVADFVGEKANRFLLPHSASNESRAFPFLSNSALLSPSTTAVTSSAYTINLQPPDSGNRGPYYVKVEIDCDSVIDL